MIIPNQAHKIHVFRNINKFTINYFQMQLSYENSENVFNENNVNCSFHNFLNTYIKLFDSSFPVTKAVNYKGTSNIWMTTGIKISCKKRTTLCKIQK
jgi:hypothetical protein